MTIKILIFGAGLAGRRAIEHYDSRDDTTILCLADNAKEKHGSELEGYTIVAPHQIQAISYDKIIIASMYHQEIYRQLTKELNLREDTIEVVPIGVAKGNIDLQDEQRRALARELLLGACSTLTNAGVRYHIDHGTLLGLYREGDLLRWDNDVDIAIHAEDLNSATQVLEEFGKTFQASVSASDDWVCRPERGVIDFGSHRQECVRILKIENRASCMVSQYLQLDVIVKYPHKKLLNWLVGMITLRAPESYLNEVEQFAYHGMGLAIPRDTEEYLTLLYGDWKVPQIRWDHVRYKNIVSLT